MDTQILHFNINVHLIQPLNHITVFFTYKFQRYSIFLSLCSCLTNYISSRNFLDFLFLSAIFTIFLIAVCDFSYQLKKQHFSFPIIALSSHGLHRCNEDIFKFHFFFFLHHSRFFHFLPRCRKTDQHSPTRNKQKDGGRGSGEGEIHFHIYFSPIYNQLREKMHTECVEIFLKLNNR